MSIFLWRNLWPDDRELFFVLQAGYSNAYCLYSLTKKNHLLSANASLDYL